MGDKITLKVEERTLHGKKVKQLRNDGLTPGVVYGPGMDPVSVQVPEGELKKVVAAAGRHSPVHLTGSKRRIAMIKDVELEPTKNEIRHISFHAVRADQPVTTEVPIHLVDEGESEAEKNGLIILQTLDRVEIKALPMDLPEAIEISTKDLTEEGEKLTLAAANLPEGVAFVEHEVHRVEENDEDYEAPKVTDQVVASVWEPAALQAANEAAAGDAEDESEVESENGDGSPEEASEVDASDDSKKSD